MANQYEWNQASKIMLEIAQHSNENIVTSSLSIRTPLNINKEMLKPTSRNLDMDIDDDHVNKKIKLSQGTEIEIEEDCMIIDLVPGNVTLVSIFKI